MDAWVEKYSSSSNSAARNHLWMAARRCFAKVIPALVLSACSSGAPPVPNDHLSPRQAVKSAREVRIERFKKDTERLASVRFDDAHALDEQLQTHLGDVTRQGPMDERTAERGMLGELEIRNITLRRASHDPAYANLIFYVAPPSIAIKEIIWEDSSKHPARPDARGSRPYWSAQVNGAKVTLGLDSDGVTLTYVSIRQPLPLP